MDLREAVGDRERLVRTLLAVGLSAVAISSLRKGRRLSGLLAAGGALAVGYTAATPPEELEELTETLDVGTVAEDLTDEASADEDSTAERSADRDAKLRCAACGDPIGPGQTRGPNEQNEIVHLDCK